MTVEKFQAAFTAVAWSWADTKLFLENSVAFSSDSLHVLAGVAVFLLAAAVIRKPVSNIWPWLVVLVLTCANEFIDLWIQRWPELAAQYGESAKDVLLTMALPTLLMLSARLAPALYRPPPGS